MALKQIRSLDKHRLKKTYLTVQVKYINKLKSMRPDVDVVCGYEAGA